MKKKTHIVKTIPIPRNIKPMLAVLVDNPFDNPNWVFEIKWDGYRAIAEIENGKVNLYSRNNLSFNDRYTTIVEELERLDVTAVLDGEVVILTKDGIPSFQDLQNFIPSKKESLRYYVFDILYLQGYDLRHLSLIERKKILKKLLSPKLRHIFFCNHILGEGKPFFKKMTDKGYEGIIAKEANSPYIQGRSNCWLKIKSHKRQEAIICGFTAPKGSRTAFGSLILGVYKGDKLEYIGNVGTGFNENNLDLIYKKLIAYKQKISPFKNPPKLYGQLTWVEPKFLCEIKFSEWTKEGQMRQPVFLGLREDKKPKEVEKEKTVPISKIVKEKAVLTNLDKVFWPREGYDKGDLLHYYKEVSPFILPYLKDRPETLHRYPNGIETKAFYQKNATNVPAWVKTEKIEHENKTVNYIIINDQESLLYVANLGCIEMNPFNSRIQSIMYPDYMVLDLDPEDISFDKVIETAKAVHEVLEEIDVTHVCKTSGATGIHIFIPLGAQYTHEQSKQFGNLVVNLVHQRLPDITSIERSPSKRQKKVYLDYLQNNFGQTVASAYSVRPYPGAPVSTPLKWSELKKGLDPSDFTIKNVLKRFKKVGDLFEPALGPGIDLIKCLKKIG